MWECATAVLWDRLFGRDGNRRSTTQSPSPRTHQNHTQNTIQCALCSSVLLITPAKQLYLLSQLITFAVEKLGLVRVGGFSRY